MTGRPTECNDALSAAIAKDIEAGATLADAAELNGIGSSTLGQWMRKGADGVEPYAAFRAAVTRARQSAKQAAIAAVRAGVLNSGFPDWKASQAWLAAMFPDEWAEQRAVNVKLGKQLDEAIERLKKIQDRLGAELYALVLATLAGEPLDENLDVVAEGADAGGAGPG